MIKTITTTTLRNSLKDAMDHIRESKKPLIITERSLPTAVLIDLDEFEDLLSSKQDDYRKSIARARMEAKKGQVFSMEDVFGDII